MLGLRLPGDGTFIDADISQTDRIALLGDDAVSVPEGAASATNAL